MGTWNKSTFPKNLIDLRETKIPMKSINPEMKTNFVTQDSETNKRYHIQKSKLKRINK